MAETLAKVIKAKFPGVYDDMDDRELEQKVRSKFPGAYDDFPSTAGTSEDGTPRMAAAEPPRDKMREWFGRPEGAQAALQGTTGIGATPFAERPLRGVSMIPGGVLVEGRTPNELAEALPYVGGALGGIIAGGPTAGLASVGGAAFGGAAGEAARQMVRRLMDRKAPGTSGEAAKAIAGQAALQGTAEGVGVVGRAALAKMAPRLMQSALKPGQRVLKEYGTTAPKIVKTLLDEGVNVTPGGVKKLQGLLSLTNKDIAEAVKASTGEIQKKAVAARVAPTALRTARQVNPVKDLEAVGGVVDEFMQHPVYSGPALTVPEAQALKVGTYRQIGKKYGEVSAAQVEAQKALARGLKEEVADAVPGISALNKRDAELMAALDATGARVAQSANRDPVGFAWVTQNPATFLAALMDRNPTVKSLIARGMYDSAGKVGNVSPQVIRAAVVALATSEDEK